MIFTIKNEFKHSDIFSFWEELTKDEKQSLISHFGIDKVKFEQDSDIQGLSDDEAISLIYHKRSGHYIVEYVDDRNMGYIRVLELDIKSYKEFNHNAVL